MGLWVSFAFVTAMLALMGWSVYSTHRESPTETLQESKYLTHIDAIDVLVILVTWLGVSLMLELASELDTLSDSRRSTLEVLSAATEGYPGFAVGAGAAWLRRRFLPRTVIRFHRDNLALRCGSIFYGLASLFALVHGFVARWLEESSFLIWSFFLTAGGLLALALWCHMIEFRRRPRPSSGDVAEGSAGPGR